jgi:hypothetical protein
MEGIGVRIIAPDRIWWRGDFKQETEVQLRYSELPSVSSLASPAAQHRINL